jgi:hypothetical protein
VLISIANQCKKIGFFQASLHPETSNFEFFEPFRNVSGSLEPLGVEGDAIRRALVQDQNQM